MTHFRTSSPPEARACPESLHDFLQALERTETSEDVWTLIVGLAASVGLPVVDYVCASDFQNWEQVQFIRTTISSDWIAMAQANPKVRKYSTFRQHSVFHLTPLKIGLAYADRYPDMTADRLEMQHLAARFGSRAAWVIPLRMEVPGQAAHLLFGGDYEAGAFDALIDRHGWTLHAAALSAHTRYTELFKAEFCDRNMLSGKQRELLTLLGQGLQDKQIAHALGVSFSTVRQRISLIQKKTGTTNRAEVAALAMRIGLVPDPLIKNHETDLTVFLSTGDGKKGKETRG
ncbi:helix-turn-helix transcriptional regulator [Pseudaestuariivita atlantica]|uniref:HTH luxR-type domain-containing protein n=1 Tax=Pseudaestuariivita atlantica TaxID=1317121 RepID=A0A0L1JR08_9RHOB|nr:LuxR C-terminal-related transcriptional regulator [Pseudaestuariivita atlantica]KNG93838.1 hypothetical protein ATO11_11765 [Pseudaestuariivita atlantica]